MIRDLLKNSEYFVLKWYATLHLQQQRMMKLYSDGGITREVANRELRIIYRWMKVTRFLDNSLIVLLSKAQTIGLERS